LHEQDNTGHEVQAIPNQLRCKKWGIQSITEIQQGAIVYLLLDEPIRRNTGISGMPVVQAAHASQGSHSHREDQKREYTEKMPTEAGSPLVVGMKLITYDYCAKNLIESIAVRQTSTMRLFQ
jgi:hypothetical protein